MADSNPWQNQDNKNSNKVMLENIRPQLSDKELDVVSDVYRRFYKWRDERSGTFAQLQYKSLEDMLAVSRKIFWNSSKTGSEDLEGLGLNFSMGFARKEVKDFLGKLISLNIKPRFSGSNLDQYGVRVLQAMYDKWRMHSNDRVEKFWELLYGIVNGTVCKFVGYNDSVTERKFLRKYNAKTGQYDIEKKEVPFWDDVWGEIVPIEDIYLSKLYERNIRKQGRLIWKTQMDWKDFQREFSTYDNAEYVYPGNRLADDSLYFKLLGGSGVTTTNKVEILKQYDEIDDSLIITANGVWLNPIGKGNKVEKSPLPFNHKHLPFVWGILDPIDDKFAYGMPMPFASKDPHKLLNTSYCVTPDTKILTKDLRWVRAEELKTGDFIVGFEEYGKDIGKGGRGSIKERKLQDATIVGTGRKMAPVFELSLSDGTKLKCTGNHRWLTWNHNGAGIKWMRTDEIKNSMENKKWRGVGRNIFMPKPFDVVEKDESYDGGYLGGLLDGEGTLNYGQQHRTDGRSSGMQLSFIQNEGVVLEKGSHLLKKYGFDFSIGSRKADSCKTLLLHGGSREVMRALMMFRPERLIKNWSKKRLHDSSMRTDVYPKILSVAFLGEREIITLESSSKTYIAEGFCAHNTMLMERELRTISPPVLTSDIEAPDIIFGDQKVIPVNDVDAYKEMELQPAGNDFFATINSLQQILTSQAQGGSTPINGKQPTSARQQMQIAQQQQLYMASTMLMYYDMVRQEIELMLKTAIQFYPMARYREHAAKIVRAINVPNSSLTGGGTGMMKVRIIKGDKSTPVALFMEALQESIQNGNQTEIMEVPLEIFEAFDFDITRIDLEQEQTSDMERQSFMEQVLTPMMQIFAPAGLVDPQKAMLRTLIKMKEHPADWMPDKILPQVYAAWKKQNTIPTPQPMQKGQQGGAITQSMTGMQHGGSGAQGMTTPFGSQGASKLPAAMNRGPGASIGQ